MKIDRNVDLFKYSTMRTHSIASFLYTPNSEDELLSLVYKLKKDFYILGGGSNIVFASRVEKPIINLMELDNNIELNKDATITAGCSVRIQKLINFGKENELGGFEYLYSLPASVGGIIYMNAGRGRIYNQQISDWLKSVKYLDVDSMQIKEMVIDKSQWNYRCSPFHKMNSIILSATFNMQKETTEGIMAKIKERIEIVKNNQEAHIPSCGSVFNENNKYLMFLIRGKRIGGAHFSTKVKNWISNDKNGTAEDVIALIEYAKRLHNIFGFKCIPEIRIFK